MTAWVLLLRGVNVGGAGKLPMAALRALVGSLGGVGTETCVQSGNAVFTGTLDADAFAGHLAAGIEAGHGFRPRVLLIPAGEFRDIVARYPFPEARAEPKTGHVWFTTAPPSPDRAAMQALAAPAERFEITSRACYLHAPAGIGQSKLAERVERLLGVPATARNLNTCTKLVAMLDARGH